MKSLPVLDALDHCARIGYRNVEICIMEEFPTEVGKFDTTMQHAVRDRTLQNDLEISSLLFHGAIFGKEQKQQEDLETIKRAGEISNVLDEKKPPLLESVMGGKKEEWDVNKNLMVDRLGKWAEAAGSSGVKVAVKAHAGNAVYTSEQLLWLYHAVNHPALTLTYDYSHYKVEGFDMETTMREVIPHAGFIHVKDVELSTPYRFLLPGEGTIDWVKYFRILKELDYTGPILVEVSAHIHRLPNYEPLPSAQSCYDALSKARDAAYSNEKS
ncbi:MAG: sugar phosphate isomerase/epimerase family protein [Pirellulaceae bacterium]|nr:sugar phosphate isomerase/epimerase family protein [Pirellulaceae bacterium]